MNYFTAKTFFSLNYQGEVIPAEDLNPSNLKRFSSEEAAVKSAEAEIEFFNSLREDCEDMVYPTVAVLGREGENYIVLSTHE
jgi:hypothetical protein